MRTRSVGVLLLALAAAATPLGAQSTPRGPPYGPLEFEEGSPLYRLFLTPMAEAADPVGEGRLVVSSRWALANVFEFSVGDEMEQFFDLERITGGLTVRYGLTPRLEVGGRVRFERSSGGFLDGFIGDFHEKFGFPNGDREKFPEDTYRVVLVEDGGDLRLNIPSRSFGLDGVRLWGKWLAYRSPDGTNALSVRLAMNIPDGFGNRRSVDGVPDQSVNAAAGVLGRSSHGPWHWHGMLGLTSIRGDERVTELLHPVAGYFLAGGERELGQSVSFLAQFLGSTPYVKHFGSRDMDRPAVNLSLGFAGRAGASWRWQFSFTEDVPPNSPAVDLTVAAGLSRAW